MNERSSFEKRIEKTKELISFLNEAFPLQPESDSEEWPRAYQTFFHEKKYTVVFSIFGSFTLIPATAKHASTISPIYYLSLDTNPSNSLAWTKPDGEFIENSQQIIDELIRSVHTYEEGISEINSRENRI